MQRTVALWLAAVFAVGLAAPALAGQSSVSVPVVTKYITTEVETVDQDETRVFVAQLCQQSKGMQVNISVLLNNNPGWVPAIGVVRYYVVDSETKTLADALCTNVVSGVAGPTCFIKAWPGTNDMFIKATAGQTSGISFSMDAEIFSPTGRKVDNTTKVGFDRKWYEPKVRSGTVYLSEVVQLQTSQALAYHNSALLKFTFCSTPKTGKSYQIRTTVFGTDGQSSYTQYLCEKLPCSVDSGNVEAHNGRQLPSNTVVTESKQWKTLYALIVCWGGVFDAGKNTYIGHFLFSASLVASGAA